MVILLCEKFIFKILLKSKYFSTKTFVQDVFFILYQVYMKLQKTKYIYELMNNNYNNNNNLGINE